MKNENPFWLWKLYCLSFTISLYSIVIATGQSLRTLNDINLSPPDSSLFSNEITSSMQTNNQFVSWAAIGQAFALSHRYSESNQWLEKAYLLKIDEKTNHQSKKEESYDELYQLSMVLYFKSLNYLEMGDIENALIECKRMDELMRPRWPHDLARQILSEDPLIQSLMGMIFEMDHDYSDSGLSYNKARQILEVDYKDLFSKRVPKQLIENQVEMDSMAAACDIAACPPKSFYGKLIFFWHNGQGPQKEINGPDFKIKSFEGNWYSNEPENVIITDGIGNTLLPFYKFSRPIYSQSELMAGERKIKCELLEDMTWYSVWTLQERLKSDGVHVWRNGVNWSTLPSSVYYAVVPLASGVNKFEFTAKGGRGSIKESFTIVGDGKIHFHTVTTLASTPISIIPYASKVIDGISVSPK
jgi:uncharacterized protein